MGSYRRFLRMRIFVDPPHLTALHDFLTRGEWDVVALDGTLVARGHPQLAPGETEEQLRLTLGVWRAMHPAAEPPRLVPCAG